MTAIVFPNCYNNAIQGSGREREAQMLLTQKCDPLTYGRTDNQSCFIDILMIIIIVSHFRPVGEVYLSGEDNCVACQHMDLIFTH